MYHQWFRINIWIKKCDTAEVIFIRIYKCFLNNNIYLFQATAMRKTVYSYISSSIEEKGLFLYWIKKKLVLIKKTQTKHFQESFRNEKWEARWRTQRRGGRDWFGLYLSVCTAGEVENRLGCQATCRALSSNIATQCVFIWLFQFQFNHS